mmetsp:Transcript_74758/g.207880  ORF Transcript_74758/g.207880 Transcript_74758/m.207880 type:complete len:228 (+) Transcript_74758:208-891(+)
MLGIPCGSRGAPQRDPARRALRHSDVVVNIEKIEEIQILDAGVLKSLFAIGTWARTSKGPRPCLAECVDVVRDRLESHGRASLRQRPLEARNVTEEKTAKAQQLEDSVLVDPPRAILETLHRGDNAIDIPAAVERRGWCCSLPCGHNSIPVREIYEPPTLSTVSALARELAEEGRLCVQLALVSLCVEHCVQDVVGQGAGGTSWQRGRIAKHTDRGLHWSNPQLGEG